MKKKLDLFFYLRRVSRALDCPPARRRVLLEKVRRDAEPLLAERPGAEASACLGDPKELARGLLETLDQRELEQYRRRRTILRRGLIAFLAAALIGVSTWAIYLYRTPIKPDVTERITIYHTEPYHP